MRSVTFAPQAADLIESLRDFGYSLETAVSEIIDNSITARSTHIAVFAETDGQQGVLAILDDGSGMSEAELVDAIRLGSRNPLGKRPNDDLGRFGLGLKTASFSQARTLTVVSRRKENEVCAAIWDLDHIAQKNDWSLLLLDHIDHVPFVSELGSHGTLVVWQNLDRLIETTNEVTNQNHFAQRIHDLREHLALVFHRFIAYEQSKERVVISVNGTELQPVDPFASSHPATQRTPVETIELKGHRVALEGFTLPHHTKCTAREFKEHAGNGGHIKNQGFYVYRERRLIISGTWFGLATKGELTKLCRVKVDLKNGIDSEWKIDVKKANAQPPYVIRRRMKELIDVLRVPSERTHNPRPHVRHSDERLPAWTNLEAGGKSWFVINPEQPLVAEFRKKP